MKFRTTRKEIMNGFNHVLCVGYADLDSLLNLLSPVGYTCGRDGWNADVYDLAPVELYGWAIVSGYRPFGNLRVKHETAESYNKAAREIMNNSPEWEKRQKLLTDLLKSFIQSVKIENGLAKIDATETV